MSLDDAGLPIVGWTYASKEKRSLGKRATVLEPAPTRYGFVHLKWLHSGANEQDAHVVLLGSDD